MARLSTTIALAGLTLASLASVRPVAAADLFRHAPTGRFLATCEDLGGLCFADACGRDQIEAALRCRALCPSSAVMDVVPTACLVPDGRASAVLRRRG